jgi:hypothetical protein
VVDVEDRRDLWVIDTSSVLEIRRRIHTEAQRDVYRRVGELVESDLLFYPKEVLDELKRRTVEIAGKKGKRDLPYDWAAKHAAKGTRHRASFEALRIVLAVPGVAQLIDIGSSKKEADAYVLTLAYQLNVGGAFVRVITEDRRNAPDKLALASACGLVGIPVVPVKAFLLNRGIWTGEWGT